ncbi:hypothetical protein CRM22_010066 [Opisthorchis felineus]|uniref:Uncharacterized protein n=1 Tax=Opisthorchis felineus TaxID=147828 RepID=A0A4S2L2W3_OPIFE|nr:hypothetical protein CRM22_010066 [Opisthorchis felineus]
MERFHMIELPKSFGSGPEMRLFGASSDIHEKLQNEYWECYVNLHRFIQSTTSLVATLLRKVQQYKHAELQALKFKLTDTLHQVQSLIQKLLEIQGNITRFDREYCSLDLFLSSTFPRQRWLITPRPIQNTPVVNGSPHREEETASTGTLIDALDLTGNGKPKRISRKKINSGLDATANSLNKRYSAPLGYAEVQQALASRFVHFQSDLRRHLCVAWNLLSGFAWLAVASALIRCKFRKGILHKHHLNESSPNQTAFFENLIEYMTSEPVQVLARQLTMWRLVQDPCSAKKSRAEDRMTHQLQMIFTRLRTMNGTGKDAPLDDMAGMCHVLFEIQNLFHDIQTHRQRYTNISLVPGSWQLGHTNIITSSNAVTLKVFVRQLNAHCIALTGVGAPLKTGYKRSQIVLYCSRPLVSVWPSINSTTCCSKTQKSTLAIEEHVYERRIPVCGKKQQQASESVNNENNAAACVHEFDRENGDVHFEEANSKTADRVVSRFVCPSTFAKCTHVSISVRPKQSSYDYHKISNDSITSSYTSEIIIFLTASHKTLSREQTRLDISASPGDCSRSQISLVNHSELNESWASPLLHDSVTSDYLGVLSPLPAPEQFANVESTEWNIQGKVMEQEQCISSICTDVGLQSSVLKTDCVQRTTVSRDLESSRLSVLDPIPECDSQANSDTKSSARGTEMTNSEHPTAETGGHVFDDLVTTTIENELNDLLVKTEELEQTLEWVAAQLCKIDGYTTRDLMVDSTRIPLHLAFIDQANEALAPLGGRIRQMLRQINQIEQSPVCGVQTEETALVQNRVKQNAVDVNLLSELRIRLKKIRKERSVKLHECEQLIIQLQQAQTLQGEISANLHSIQAELVRCSKLIDNHEDAPTIIRWTPDHGLKDQLDRFNRIATDLTERVAPHLSELSKSTKEFQFDRLHDHISDATAELEELVCIVCQKKECLERLDRYLDRLNLRAKEKLASLRNELTNLKRISFEANNRTTQEYLAILIKDLFSKCTRLQDLQSELHPVLTELFEVTQTADSNKILLQYHVQGNLEGVDCFAQHKMDITKFWAQLTDELEEQLEHLLDAVSEMVTSILSKAVTFGPAGQTKTLLQSGELLKPGRLQLQLVTIDQQISELNSHSDWIKQNIDPLLYDKSSTLILDDDKLKKRDELLSRLDEANTQLHILRDELQTVYSPAVMALNERIQKAQSFLKLLYLQSQELPKPLVNFDELDVSVSELSIASQLELLYVQQSQCQQLLRAVQNEQHCFTEDITHIWQANRLGSEQLNSLTEISAAGTQSAVDDETPEVVLGSVMNLGPGVTLKQLLQAYTHLGQKVANRIAQFHSYITELSQERCPMDESESIVSVDETDAQVTYFEVSESDSGLPGEPSLTLVDTMAQLTLLDGVNETYNHLDIDEVESELQDLVGGVDVDADVERSSADILPEGTEAESEKETVGPAGDTMVDEQVCWTSTSSLPTSVSQWLHSEEVQLRQSEAKLNELKLRYHQVVHSMLASLQEGDYSSVARLPEYFRATLTLIKEISTELSLLTGIEGSSYSMTSSLVGDDETVKENIIQLTLKPNGIPLWYRIEGLEIHMKYFVDAVNECEKLTLMAYELSERVSSMTARLGPWLEEQARILGEVSQVDQCSSTADELSSVLNTLSTTKLMIRSKAGAIGQVIHDVHLLRQTLGQFNAKINFERHLFSWDAHHQDQSTPPTIEVNSDALNLPLYTHLDRLDAVYTDLVKMCADSTRTVCTRLFEVGRADLVLRDIEQTVNDCGVSALESHPNDEKESFDASVPTIATDSSALTGCFSGIVRRKQLEVYVSELTTYQTLMDQFAGAQKQGQVPIVCDASLNPMWQRVYNRLLINLNTSSNSLLKSKCEFAQIRKVDSFMFNSASWLRRNGFRLFKWTYPRGLSPATASSKLNEFQEVCTKIEQESQAKSSQMMDNIRESILLSISSDPTIKKIVTYLEVVLLGNNSTNDQPEALDDLSAPGLRLFVHEQQRYKRFVSFLQLAWDCHVKFVAQYEEKIHELSTAFQGLHATLAKLYRPSKLVAQCNEQLMEINDAISHLQAHATTVGRMYSAVPQLRCLCQPLEVSKMLATIRSMKHEFLCLSSRAEERKKILQQALKEDIAFDTAYKRLMSTLKHYCEEKSSNPPVSSTVKDAKASEPQPRWDLQRESANYWAVLRLGCYLRDRCTQSDPERGIIDNMLTDLRHLWYACFRKQAERSLACEKALLDRGAHSEACEKLSEWIRTFESTLKISFSVSKILSVSNADILGPDIIKLMSFKWSTTFKTTNIQLICIKDDSRLRECGFSTSDLQSLVSVYGDTALVHSIQDEVRLLSEELDKRMHIWNASEPAPIDDSRRDVPLHLRMRMIRLRVALELRSKVLESAMDVATAIQQAWLTLSNWLCELEARIKRTRCQPNSINSSIHRTSSFAQSQLDTYEYARFTRTHVTAPILSCYSSVMKHLLTTNETEKSSADTWITGRCHSRAKPAMRRQFQSLISKWKQMDQLLKVFQMSLKQGGRVPQCVWDLETLECTIEKMTKDTRRELGRDQLLSKKLTEALLQSDDGKPLDNGSENGPEPNKLCQLLCDPLVKWDADNPLTIECYLNQCEAQLINATTMKSQVNSLKSHLMVTLSAYKKVFIMVESCGTSDNTASLYDHSANTVVDSQATVDEPDTISNSWSQDSTRRDSALALSSLRDSFTELKLDSHTDEDNADQLEAMLVLRRGRCRKLEEEFSQLKQLILCRTENSRVLRDALCERIKLDQFDFETWRQNFLKWQTKRHFRVSDLFKAALPVDTSSAQRSSGTTFSTDGPIYSEDDERCTNDYSTSSDIAITSPNPTDKTSMSPNKSVAFGSGKQRLKCATSLEHLGVADKQETSLNIELTCSQFVQGVHRHRPDFRGSDCVSLRAAFAEIDKNRRGRITIKQLMDVLQPERQRQEIPVSQLIQNAIDAETKKCRCKTKFVPVKVDENRYRFGPSSQLYLVRFLNSITMVRVGGGWQNLTEFLATRDPCRARNKPPQPDSPSVSSTRTHQVSPAQSVTLSRSSPNSNLGSMRVTTLSRTSAESSGSSNTTPAKLTARGAPKQAPKSIPTTTKRIQGQNTKSAGKLNLKDGLENGKSH